ncbi:PREDICTED: uncharacterized protein LOC104611817 [Nelumbo nucifera]|uniref:Uncharacterized protein n=2 Tax=Nelumbo nucifera TaxID=4432 RepID=A0A822YJ96_NELNU|nr:PREDICTED: uncharacterized protein LOC104611817 [Nelumbo nucifera]DAD32650.1 TPA_asm: hypothetical protein HUJ06_011501 [Nelumbo nucifera]
MPTVFLVSFPPAPKTTLHFLFSTFFNLRFYTHKTLLNRVVLLYSQNPHSFSIKLCLCQQIINWFGCCCWSNPSIVSYARASSGAKGVQLRWIRFASEVFVLMELSFVLVKHVSKGCQGRGKVQHEWGDGLISREDHSPIHHFDHYTFNNNLFCMLLISKDPYIPFFLDSSKSK